jgi:hypothetical protein
MNRPMLNTSAFLVLTLVLVSGCTTSRQTDTARTAREQLLISNAVDQSLAKVDFSAFHGQRVLVEEKYLDCVDKGYVVGSIRHRLLLNGASIAPKPEEADVVMEIRSGSVGTDDADSYLGMPQIVLPGMLTLPEVKLVTRNRQSAMAKIGLVAYDAKTNQLLGAGGVSSSISDEMNLYVLGIGPFQSGTARAEINETTPRRINQPNQSLPSSVAFNPGSGSGDQPSRLQLTGDRQPANQ